ncbi:iron-containing alcohol dehydrogenase [Eubacterium xylanophilum]|uniref:iron-containing alcohol dehydrogenase n=1 Tax=Eubacterium xylanophilum TaxID=39497 RepID=UPI00047AAA54|nr:iron-containing alcohol dehydrogenase [Eubacterium xylanophilum]
MDNFQFYSPTYFEFGRGAEDKVGELLKRFGASKVLIHYGGGSVQKSGLLDKVRANLEKADIPFFELGGVKPNPRSGLVYEGIDICKKEGIDFILAVGGGSVIDSSKAIAAGACSDEDFINFYRGKAKFDKALPVGTILTIAASGSEGSGNSVINDEEIGKKKGIRGDVLRPKFSILNPEWTMTLPAYQTAAGCTDIMAHVCERYFSNTEGVEVTDRLCEALLKTILKEAPIVIENPKDYDARANIMWAGMLAHNNVCGVGRVQDWASHHIEHELSALYDVTHGAGLAVIMPAWMRYVVNINPGKLVDFARNVMEVEEAEDDMATAMRGIEKFEAFLKSIGMPLTFDEIGAKEEDIDYLTEKLLGKNKTEGNYVKLEAEDVKKIYHFAANR